MEDFEYRDAQGDELAASVVSESVRVVVAFGPADLDLAAIDSLIDWLQRAAQEIRQPEPPIG